MDLEKTVVEYEKAGREWIEAKLKADQLEEGQKSFLAAIVSELDDGDTAESKLERKARASKEYRDYVTRVCIARAEMLRLKVKFDSWGMLFSARQSQRAFERETIKKGIFSEGG